MSGVSFDHQAKPEGSDYEDIGGTKSSNAQAPKREKRRHAVNKTELVEETADQPGPIRKTSTEAIGAVISAVTWCLARQERTSSVGFWNFTSHGTKSKKRKESSNRPNCPNTDKEIPVVWSR